jgi:hypothetical protein
MRTIVLYCWFLILQYNILVLSDAPIQYIGIVRRTATIYWYCPTDQCNILVLSSKQKQYIVPVQPQNFDLKGFQHTA